MKIKPLGEIDWQPARVGRDVGEGDTLKTDPRAGAEITFLDGMVLRVSPESLLRIERVRPSLSAGGLVFRTDPKRAPGPAELETPSFKWTESAEPREPSRGALEMARSGEGAIDQHAGHGTVRTRRGDSIELKPNERLPVDGSGKAQRKVSLPDAPRLLTPEDHATLSYDDPATATTALKWSPVPAAVCYRVMVDRGGFFADPLFDRSDIDGTSLELRGMAPGKYYWHVAALSEARTQGAFAEFARFTVIATATGPPLVVEPIDVRRNVVHIKGRTQPGATVTVNGQPIDVAGDGSFGEFVTLGLGQQKLTIKARGAHGGETVLERSLTVSYF